MVLRLVLLTEGFISSASILCQRAFFFGDPSRVLSVRQLSYFSPLLLIDFWGARDIMRRGDVVAYFDLVAYLGGILSVVSGIVVLSFLLAPWGQTEGKIQPYECGFEPFGEDAQGHFEVHFYVVGILFLLFDLEVVFLFPWLFSFVEMSSYFFYNVLSILLFLLILGLGLLYEWSVGALDWSTRSW